MKEFKFLSKEFLRQYADKKVPFTPLGEFVYLRTYSRYDTELGRREKWIETIARTVDYSVNLAAQYAPYIDTETLRKEAEVYFDFMFNLASFPSGRSLWIAGTPVAEKYPLGNFNCAFIVMNSFEKFQELFYLLMVGAGVGIRILPSDVEQLPSYRVDVETFMKPYNPLPKSARSEDTYSIINGDAIEIFVGDSKEGWTEALALYFRVITNFAYRRIKYVLFNFDSVRPKGEPLKTFGGTASGHESIQIMFKKISKVLKRANGKLKTIDVLDIDNIIGENVVVGGVRRTAQIHLFSADDKDVREAKNNLYVQNNGKWEPNLEISHRAMSNNSIYFEQKPSREQLHEIMKSIRVSGEPGFINAEAAKLRRQDFEGVNPCGEILLRDRQTCNLTTNNLMAFVENGDINWTKLEIAIRLSTRAGIRMTLPTLEIPQWDITQKQDRLIGVSLTGYQDCVNALGFKTKTEKENFKRALRMFLRKIVHDESKSYSAILGIKEPLLATTVKPEGTISQLPTVSSGLHQSHSPFFIRRVRISAHAPLAKAALAHKGWRIHPEVGQEMETASTLVIEFPVKSPKGTTKYDVSAIEQLEEYKSFMEEYVDHNASITVSVRDHEWEAVEEWVYNNWGSIIGISFLSLSDHFYPLAPYEAITEEEYNVRVVEMEPFDANKLQQFEITEEEEVENDAECSTGACPVR